MGQNDEYSRDAHEYDMAYESDTSDEVDLELHPEDWQDMYSQEILDAWMLIRGYLDENYIKNRAHYPDFVELVLEPQNWYATWPPPDTHRILWNLISDMPIVSERVTSYNFYAWAQNYIDYE